MQTNKLTALESAVRNSLEHELETWEIQRTLVTKNAVEGVPVIVFMIDSRSRPVRLQARAHAPVTPFNEPSNIWAGSTGLSFSPEFANWLFHFAADALQKREEDLRDRNAEAEELRLREAFGLR